MRSIERDRVTSSSKMAIYNKKKRLRRYRITYKIELSFQQYRKFIHSRAKLF